MHTQGDGIIHTRFLFMCVTRRVHMCDTTHSYVWHTLCICRVTQHCTAPAMHICDMTNSYVWHNSFICATWPIHMQGDAIIYTRFLFVYVTRLIHMCDMTRSYVRHDSFVYVTWLSHMCDMTHIICVTGLIFMCVCVCVCVRVYVWPDPSMCVAWRIHMRNMTYGVTSHMQMRHVAYTNE